MRTTLVIPDSVYRALKRRAVERDETISGLVTEFIRRGLAQEPAASEELQPLPALALGRPRVDVSDRDALYRLFDAGDDSDPEDADPS